MANPRSVTIMTGWLASDVRFVSDKYGKEFQARFVLKVQRSYKNKEGHYESDFFQARLNGSEGRHLIMSIMMYVLLIVCLRAEINL